MVAMIAALACHRPTDSGTDPGGTSPPPPHTTGSTGETGDTAAPPITIPRVFDDQHVLVVPDSHGLQLLSSDGTTTFFRSWSDLVGCSTCGGEGASADGDGLLVAVSPGPSLSGVVARLDRSWTAEWVLRNLPFPHDAIRDPSDGSVIVPEAWGDRVDWFVGDGSSPYALRALDRNDRGFPADQPNGADRLDYGGRTWLLESHRGGEIFGPSGEITLWDMTNPDNVELAWRFPSGDGSLYTPHGCILRPWNGRWWLVWAHSDGVPGGSSVGLAVADEPTDPPEYVADLVPAEGDPAAPFRFLRGVELTEDGWLWLTDSGDGGINGGDEGRIFRAPMPEDLAPTGASGDADSGQVLVDLDGLELVRDGLGNPFEGWLWVPPT